MADDEELDDDRESDYDGDDDVEDSGYDILSVPPQFECDKQLFLL
jgi:hypothetical protein